MLDISVESRFARAGICAAKTRLATHASAITRTILAGVGRPGFIQGGHSGEVYAARFTTEDAARTAMGYAEFDLSDMRITPRGRGATLTGIMGCCR